MPTTLERTVAPTEDDQRLASRTSEKLDSLKPDADHIRLQVLNDDAVEGCVEDEEHGLAIPALAFQLLSEILKEMARGNAVTVVPIQMMLSTQQAADILNVSRPFIVSLLEGGKIPYQRLGSHRRIRVRDLMVFKEKADTVADEALRALAEEAQELGLGY